MAAGRLAPPEAGTCAQLFGRILRARYREDAASSSSIELRIVTDTDFRDQETEEQFRESALEWPLTTRLITSLGSHPDVRDARRETEQKEPLLLLAERTEIACDHVGSSQGARLLGIMKSGDVGCRVIAFGARGFQCERPCEFPTTDRGRNPNAARLESSPSSGGPSWIG
jgi:hypothetical protein